MRITMMLLLALFAAAPLPAADPPSTPAQSPGPEHDFDYLLGDWEFTANSKQWGKFHGLWSAVRLEEGQILDEYRVVGDDGKTIYVTTTLRNYNKATQEWELVGVEAGNGLRDVGTAKRSGAEMHIQQKFGKSLARIRYSNIEADRFSWRSDQSLDGGKTWSTNHMTIEARRIGPARTLPALTKGGAAAR